MSFNDAVGVDHDQSRPDEGEDVVAVVAVHKVPQHLWFVEDVHLAHVGEDLSVAHLKGEGRVESQFDFGVMKSGLVLHLVLVDDFEGSGFEEGRSLLVL